MFTDLVLFTFSHQRIEEGSYMKKLHICIKSKEQAQWIFVCTVVDVAADNDA